VDVLLFSDNPKLRLAFKARGAFRLRPLGWKDFRREIAAPTVPTLCYLDLATLPAGQLAGCLRLIRARPQLSYGLVDRRGQQPDVARLFQEGAADYVDREALAAGVTAKRLLRVVAFLRTRRSEVPVGLPGVVGGRLLPSGTDWSEVTPEREYTFCLLFIELDGREEMEKKYGVKNLGIALASFRSYLENAVKPAQGRLWIWTGFGGIVLFPFSGADCPALGCLFRLVLFRHLYDVEESQFPNFLSYRLAMMIGNLTYTQANVGSVVSDSLNSVFHLGQEFSKPGQFCLTDDVLRFGHPALKEYFLEAGNFEGRRILRMRIPRHRRD
jgi:hypothetical protein